MPLLLIEVETIVGDATCRTRLEVSDAVPVDVVERAVQRWFEMAMETGVDSRLQAEAQPQEERPAVTG